VQWTSKIATIRSLTISHFNPQPGESLTPFELLNSLPEIDLEVMCIADLFLHPSPDHIPLLWYTDSVAYLKLEGLHDPQIIDEILFGMRDPQNLSFTRCTFGDYADGFGEGLECEGDLALTEINQDLSPLLRRWTGHMLHVSDCPRFDDIALNMMSSVENGVFTCAPHARDLSIQNCPNFSFSALRRLVQSRLHLPSHFDHAEPTPTRLRGVLVLGNVPSLSQEDRSWFVANVPRFHYNSWQN
jgi:hypothetical protein